MLGREPADVLLEAEGTSDHPGGLMPESCSSWGVAVSRVGSTGKASRMRLIAMRSRAGVASAARVGSTKTPRDASCRDWRGWMNGFLPESIVRHMVVLSTDGAGSIAVPASYLH
jgi:hypothetical protein